MEENNNPIQNMENKNIPNEMRNQNLKVNALGMTSFIVSLIGLLIMGLPCGIVATITGIIGIAKFNPNTEKGKWMAITGLIIGIIDAVVVLFYAVIRQM